MKIIQNYIDSKQQGFMNHPFFELLEHLDSLDQISYFVPELTFWALTFQDVLRINETRVTDPELRKIARHHRQEDAGHERWFMYDKNYMGEHGGDPVCKNNDVNWLFGRDLRFVRDACYEIVSEVYKADHEILNIVLLLTLESTGHVFFEKVVKQIKKTGEDKNLKYFSSSHLEVELAHALFEEEMERKLFSREIPVDLRRDAVQMIDRCYEGFGKMFDGLIETCNNRLDVATKKKSLKREAKKHMDPVSY